MPWQERSRMEQRQEFVTFAMQEEATIAELCRRAGISRKTGYKWLERAQQGDRCLADRSRRPHTSPHRTAGAVEALVVALRREHPAWGGRKLHHWLVAHGVPDAPPSSTITAILHRHGLIASVPPPPRPWHRFEHVAPNDVWQMDFMGHRPLERGRVHPLTVLDDHSRFAVGIAACANEQHATVQAQLTAWFQRYGLPRAILSDNGSPWASAGRGGLTRLEAWLLCLGVEPWHGRPAHPQTQGKVERFHATLAAEVFRPPQFSDVGMAQTAFTRFRTIYNHERPHEALDYAVPVTRYHPSPRRFPERLPEISYGPADAVRIVTVHGSIQWHQRRYFVSRGLVGQPVAVRPTTDDGCWEVVFCHRPVALIDLNDPDGV